MAKAFYSGWSPGEPLERALVAVDAWNTVYDGYRNNMVEQIEFARKAMLVSPYACFCNGVETISETGIAHFKRFLDRIRDHRFAMRQQLLNTYTMPLKWFGNEKSERFMKLWKPIDFESIPKFHDTRTPFPILLNRALQYLLLLVLLNMILFAGAFVGFLRYDVR
jgi:hypothetical protein